MLVLITTVKTEDRVACGKTFFGSRDWKVLISGWSLSKGVLDQTVLCLKKKKWQDQRLQLSTAFAFGLLLIPFSSSRTVKADSWAWRSLQVLDAGILQPLGTITPCHSWRGCGQRRSHLGGQKRVGCSPFVNNSVKFFSFPFFLFFWIWVLDYLIKMMRKFDRSPSVFCLFFSRSVKKFGIEEKVDSKMKLKLSDHCGLHEN